MSQYHFNYSFSNSDSDDENLLESNDITQYLADSEFRICNFCNKFGHSMLYCEKAKSLGHYLHLKGIEVRKFDIEMDCSGNSVKAWIENLSFMQIIVLSNKININAYSVSLFDRNFISETTSLLNNRTDYNLVLQFFYYNEPTGNLLKKNFILNVNLSNKKQNGLFECPICIESNKKLKEKIVLNCFHCICYECFDNYLSSLNMDKIPICSMCRCEIKKIDLFDDNNYKFIKRKFNFLKI
jgi:hypothetical protein